MSRTGTALSSENTIDRYKQGFQEEARDILVELESTLLALDQNRMDTELVSQAFRALHTIKGSGAMFGFTELAAFTHNLENAFDEVRNGRLQVTSNLVELSLAALDQMKAMLQEAAGQGTADAARANQILVKLQSLTGQAINERPASEQSTADPTNGSASATTTPAPDLVASDWKILFTPGPDLLRNGNDPIVLLRELGKLGTLHVETLTEAIPPIAEIDPGRCYITWQMRLTTSAAVEEIRDIFIFAEDLCELTIDRAEAQSPASIQQTTVGQQSVIAVSSDAGQSQSVTPTETPASPQPAADQPVTFGRRADDRAGVTSIRVPTAKLDQFVDLVGELVTVQARLAEIASRYEDSDVASVSEEVERLTSALRENSMSIRMLPIRGTFERFRRLVHDLARDLHKEVELTIDGADTELDKTVIDQLNDPLMHLIRNSMDHGIESAESRIASGKPAIATIHLAARHAGANVLIEVSDDGGGINAVAVRSRAIERGLIAPDAQLTEPEVFSLILMPGFSTAEQITDVSGRGVGMDVVRQRVESLRGTIQIDSKPGHGTTITLRLPLTLAIIDGLLVRVGEAYFVLPLANSLECIELTRQDVAAANGKHIANVRGEIIPYIRLREYFDIQTQPPEIEQIMIAETEDGRCGFVVDEVLGDHQTVIKNLGRFYRHVQFISGATILGNGTLALILDPNRVVQDAMKQEATKHNATKIIPIAPRESALATIPAAVFATAKDGACLNTS
jgi:two-component system chemotaxis sensor kinase CheA